MNTPSPHLMMCKQAVVLLSASECYCGFEVVVVTPSGKNT